MPNSLEAISILSSEKKKQAGRGERGEREREKSAFMRVLPKDLLEDEAAEYFMR
jgi:hypothetical protein